MFFSSFCFYPQDATQIVTLSLMLLQNALKNKHK